MAQVEEQIGRWREYLQRRSALREVDVAELEGHLRDQMAALGAAGLDADEAFLVAVKRMGSLDALSLEFAKEHSERLWKQLVIGTSEPEADRRRTVERVVVVALAALAGLSAKSPEWFGVHLFGGDERFYARNACLFVWPLLAGYFLWKRAWTPRRWVPFALGCAAAAIAVNAYPYAARSHTEILAAIHLPIALWLAVGVAYAGGRWGTVAGRMDFVRFSGELFIYAVLILCGGVVLTGFTIAMFAAIGLKVDGLAREYLFVCGTAATPIVGAWLVEAKQSAVENMAPVLTQIFSPLFAVVMLAFLGTMVATGHRIAADRNVLIGFDLMLVLVLGMLLYAVSARPAEAPPGWPDALRLVMIGSALVVDVVALWGIAARISEFGWTPNKVAALGENLILLANLSWSGVLYVRFLRRRGGFAAIEAWQTAYLPIYSAWAAVVVAVFPPLFGYS